MSLAFLIEITVIVLFVGLLIGMLISYLFHPTIEHLLKMLKTLFSSFFKPKYLKAVHLRNNVDMDHE